MGGLESDNEVDADVDRVAEAARQRLRAGVDVDLLLRQLRPPPPRPEARWREDGPAGAWRQIDAPLLGLGHLDWKEPEGGHEKRLREILTTGLGSPQAIRVAPIDMFRGRELIHAMFGREEVDYDLFALGDLDGPQEKEPLVLNWTAGPFARALADAAADLASCAEEYLRLCVGLIGSDQGRFAIIDRGDLEREVSLPVAADSDKGRVLRAMLRDCDPPELLAIAPNGARRYGASVLYARKLFWCIFELAHDGRIAMVDDAEHPRPND